jgi:hypothetical protein
MCLEDGNWYLNDVLHTVGNKYTSLRHVVVCAYMASPLHSKPAASSGKDFIKIGAEYRPIGVRNLKSIGRNLIAILNFVLHLTKGLQCFSSSLGRLFDNLDNLFEPV